MTKVRVGRSGRPNQFHRRVAQVVEVADRLRRGHGELDVIAAEHRREHRRRAGRLDVTQCLDRPQPDPAVGFVAHHPLQRWRRVDALDVTQRIRRCPPDHHLPIGEQRQDRRHGPGVLDGTERPCRRHPDAGSAVIEQPLERTPRRPVLQLTEGPGRHHHHRLLLAAKHLLDPGAKHWSIVMADGLERRFADPRRRIIEQGAECGIGHRRLAEHLRCRAANAGIVTRQSRRELPDRRGVTHPPGDRVLGGAGRRPCVGQPTDPPLVATPPEVADLVAQHLAGDRIGRRHRVEHDRHPGRVGTRSVVVPVADRQRLHRVRRDREHGGGSGSGSRPEHTHQQQGRLHH